MIIVQNRFSSFLLGKGYIAMCILPFLFVTQEIPIREMTTALNHERIHARQQIEMGWFFFFVWYFLEYLFRLLVYRSRHKAYLNLSFEREAYFHAGNPDYCKNRALFAWLKYI